MASPLPSSPVVIWHSERSTLASRTRHANSGSKATSWTFTQFRGVERFVQSGSVTLSRNGLTVEEGPTYSRFLAWTDIVAIEPLRTADAIADIRLRDGTTVLLGAEHLPREHALDASIERAALLGRALDQARAEGRTTPPEQASSGDG